MLEVGTIHTMNVSNKTQTSYQVKKSGITATLPFDFIIGEVEVGQLIDVFLYHDRQGNLLATMQLPKMIIGSYDWVKVKDVIPNLGVFVDIGMAEEVLVSSDDLPLFQTAWPLPDDQLYVTLSLDKKGRLLAVPASQKVFNDLYGFATEIELNDEVTGRAIRVDREGIVIITDENFRGFIHHTELEKEPRLGEKVTGRVIEVKEDGTLNISLMPLKHERMDDDAEKVLAYLKLKDGNMPFGDRSEPEAIRKTFQMSKSAFKRALGRLMKERIIEQRDGQTFLLKNKE
ncbi:S1-like domain-containing RNA-binding protein [Pseudogracilibacillus sp. SE30717A]|uniref:CvfB family protein n=1 Tax=Pseudogracilibacillus sp. SE30717A TaxID=3098293 RepID=UPI00300DF829